MGLFCPSRWVSHISEANSGEKAHRRRYAKQGDRCVARSQPQSWAGWCSGEQWPRRPSPRPAVTARHPARRGQPRPRSHAAESKPQGVQQAWRSKAAVGPKAGGHEDRGLRGLRVPGPGELAGVPAGRAPADLCPLRRPRGLPGHAGREHAVPGRARRPDPDGELHPRPAPRPGRPRRARPPPRRTSRAHRAPAAGRGPRPDHPERRAARAGGRARRGEARRDGRSAPTGPTRPSSSRCSARCAGPRGHGADRPVRAASAQPAARPPASEAAAGARAPAAARRAAPQASRRGSRGAARGRRSRRPPAGAASPPLAGPDRPADAGRARDAAPPPKPWPTSSR